MLLQAHSQVWSTLWRGFWVEAVIFHIHKKFTSTSAKALFHCHFSSHSWYIHFRPENNQAKVTVCVFACVTLSFALRPLMYYYTSMLSLLFDFPYFMSNFLPCEICQLCCSWSSWSDEAAFTLRIDLKELH